MEVAGGNKKLLTFFYFNFFFGVHILTSISGEVTKL